MEYVEGESMMQIIQRIGIINILDWRYALRMAVHVGRALDYLHGQGIVHRNITPANILVQTRDKLAKLSDVMLAKSLEASQTQQQITRPGQIVGELAYMAPERTIDSRKVDGRSDIYGLGATVYALLTGQPPCLGKTPVETVEKIRTQEPTSPKTIQLSIPNEFEKIVLRMLAKRREDRYQAVGQLVKELEEIAHEQRVAI
jgi:serine/threonine-protein kinase